VIPCNEIALLIIHGIKLSLDSFNIVIKDTENTPKYNIDEPALFSERQQNIHLLFYDFTSKTTPLSPHIQWKSKDSFFSSQSEMKARANCFLEHARKAITSALTSHEIETISQELKFTTPNKYAVGKIITDVFMQVKSELIDTVMSKVFYQLQKNEEESNRDQKTLKLSLLQ
ncbi:MAG: hypothetical protein KIT56_09600, partial [Gammaproteobacteria bacterium]|nr:hypothetical protein [Gammaproteobacteria bacterium]MCW5584107.1 hypothetical protein [Gammaproteobacteria bacterium]